MLGGSGWYYPGGQEMITSNWSAGCENVAPFADTAKQPRKLANPSISSLLQLTRQLAVTNCFKSCILRSDHTWRQILFHDTIMISVTAAANGVCRAHRHMGVHWKAVGSGRVALENDPPQTPLVSTCHKEKPSCRSPSLVLETLDIASSSVTIVGIGALIEKWAHQPRQDLNLVVHGCRQFTKGDLIQYCRSRGLHVTNKGLTINNFTLSIFIA
uniref:Wax2_C domain-containing protein n=1 Tax=Ascaris lumbricoides TaxID=6252 RepID=A0A0M3I4Q0_ASCLU